MIILYDEGFRQVMNRFVEIPLGRSYLRLLGMTTEENVLCVVNWLLIYLVINLKFISTTSVRFIHFHVDSFYYCLYLQFENKNPDSYYSNGLTGNSGEDLILF